MTSLPNPSAQSPQQAWDEATKPLRLPLWATVLRGIIAVTLWGFILVDILIIDLGIAAATAQPVVSELYKFRFLILLAVTAVSLLILPRPKFAVTVGYVALFPLVVVLWIIPKALIKNWPVVVIFLPAFHAVLANLRNNFIRLTLAILGAAAVIIADSSAVVITGMVLLLVYLLVHFVSRVRAAFAPSTVFANVGGWMRGVWTSAQSKTDTDLSGLQSGSEEYEKALGQNVLNRYLVAATLSRIARRLNNLHETRQLDLYFIGALIYTFILTAAVFSLQYIGLLRVSPTSFVPAGSAIELVGYSVGTMLHFQLSAIAPATLTAQLFTYGQVCASLVIGLLLVFIIFTSTRERYRTDVASIAAELSGSVAQLEGMLMADFDLTLRAAELKIMQVNSVMARWCLISRYGESEADRIEQELQRLMSGESELQASGPESA